MAYHSSVWGRIVWRLKPSHFLTRLNTPGLLDIFRQIFIDYSEHFTYTDFRTLVRLLCVRKGIGKMAYNENDVIKKIRESRDPDRAMQIATEIILDYLMQRESSQLQSADPLPEPCVAI